MANIVTYPLNRIEYQASDAETHFSTRISGVYTTEDYKCSVTGTNTTVTVSEGMAWIRNKRFAGKSACMPVATSVDLGVANASLPRWDVVCLQFDANKNATDIVVKNGTAASSPVLPTISQTEALYELYLCKVYRPAGSATISAGDVYDLRLDPELCGLMADSVTEIDTSAINAQIKSLTENLREEIAGVKDESALMLKSVYDADGDGVVDNAHMADNAAKLGGQLPNAYMTKIEYDADNNGIVNSADNGIFSFTHSKSGTTHSLTGDVSAGGKNIKFWASAAWVPGDILQVNGKAVQCFDTMGNRIEGEEIFGNAMVTCTLNSAGTQCFFKLGGAGLNFKVVNGTSQPASPKENTLWVNTPTAISSWDFSPTQPYKRSKTKNLIVYPFDHSTHTSNGLTFTDSGDGTVTVNGTATANAYFNVRYHKPEMYLTPGTYTLSGCTGGSSSTYYLVLGFSYDGGETWGWESCFNAPVTFTLTSSAIVILNVEVKSGVKVSNVKFSPQLEKGSSATSFVKGSAHGQVWFVTGNDSNIEINAVKKNGIWERVVAVYVLGQNNTWVAKTVKAYIGGKWIDSDIYIFSASHGINKGSWKVNGDGTVTVTADDIYLTTKDYTYGYTVCSEGVDVTNLTKVIFNVSDFYKNDSDAIYNYVGVASASTADNAFVSKVQVTAVNEYTIDVTSLSGIYYPKIQLNAHGHDDGYKSRIRVNSIKFCY